jgi:hypothetical protein
MTSSDPPRLGPFTAVHLNGNMQRRIVIAVADPLLRRAAAAEIASELDVAVGVGYAHSLALVLTLGDLAGVVVQNHGWDSLDGLDLLYEVRRRRPQCGRTLIVPLGTRDDAVRDAGAQAICWAPWEAGQLLGAVKRASIIANAMHSSQPVAMR